MIIIESKFDKEYSTQWLQEVNYLSDHGVKYSFVKTVNGITADYDTDKVYWAFYVNGTYATSGVDTTPVKEGDKYSFKVEK